MCKESTVLGPSSAKRAQLVTRADPMRVVDVLELHSILNHGADLWDRLMCGAALCCIYSRGRWNDLQHVDNWVLETGEEGDVEFASAVIDIHKTMHFSSKMPKVMELVAPGAGLDEGCWISEFMKVRELLGATYADGFPTMPAPDKSGAATVRALSSGEAGAWLRALLSDRDGLRTTTHSLKSTLLSYAAKRGISHLDRLCLGGHSHGATMSDVYARDALARPLRLLAGMISEIRSGVFLPDAGRAARFPGRRNEAALEGDAETLRLGPLKASAKTAARTLGKGTFSDAVKVDSDSDVPEPEASLRAPSSPGEAASPREPSPEPDNRDEAECGDINGVDPEAGVSSAGETSSESSTTDDDDEENQGRPSRLLFLPTPPEGTYFVQHKKLRTLHMILNGHRLYTVCGRAVDPSGPMGAPTNLRWDTPVCKQCSRGLPNLLQ